MLLATDVALGRITIIMNRFFTLLLAASCLTAVGQFVDPYGDGLCCNPESDYFVGFGPCVGGDYAYDIDCSDACGDCQSCNYGVVGECDYSCFDGCLFSEWFGGIGDVFWFPSEPTGWVDSYSTLLFDANQQETLEVILHVSLGDYGWDGDGQAQYADPISQLNYAWQLNGGEFQVLDVYWSGGNGCLWDGFQGSGFLIETQVSLVINLTQLNCDSNKIEFFEIPTDAECTTTKLFEFEIEISTCGCTNSQACNFNPMANSDDGSCDFSCCPGPGCCDVGTEWSWASNTCIVANPSDSNFDGCVQLNDLLDLLSVYGDCGAEETPWQCGDPLEYQGYDYETVQIGEQCWFAENLRAENYDNDDPIVSPAWYYWGDSLVGSQSFYGNSAICYSWSTWYDLCNSGDALSLLGRVYNLYAVLDPRGICPSGWHIPSLNEWSQLSVFLGGDSVSGEKLKSTDGWHPGYGGGGGSNDSEFNGRPGGYCNASGSFYDAGITGEWWSSTMANSGDYGHSVYLESTTSNFHTTNSLGYHIEGLSVRCIKDTE
jgi:uncharacterized protein (TIGR02145 family)